MYRFFKIFVLFCCYYFSTFTVFAESIAVIVNAANPIGEINKKQLVDIYTGRHIAFPDGRIAEPVDLADSDTLKADFYYKLTGLSVSRVNSYWARLRFTGRYLPPYQVANHESVLAYVANNTASIGYVQLTTGRPLPAKVKVVYIVK
ncbi:hypothetical protein [Gayadomonas joobiniege]|uniref:hypothetical protein n=1 Tax=Gayadomonas joobiniege TaxID=1234606 RepID=UPI00036BF91C|nr:hypothetical protein [Gayadomonas joobiniege]